MNLDDALRQILQTSGCGVHEIRTPEGEVIRFFRCNCDPDLAAERIAMAFYEVDLAEHLRDLEPLFDPNKIDTRRVRRELGDNLVNLGRKVNKVVQGTQRRPYGPLAWNSGV